MPLSLESLNFSIICDGKELETYDVRQEGPNSVTAFVASETGKQFSFMLSNRVLLFDLLINLYIDGECTSWVLRAGQLLPVQISGFPMSATSVLPFKFQELELVDPDVEDAPVVPETGTIEVRAYRCRLLRSGEYRHKDHRPHGGRVSERSKKAGWHHISTADEAPATPISTVVDHDNVDPPSAPYASVKVLYRPRELLMAEGVIIGRGVETDISGGSEANDRKRANEDGSPGPSIKRRERSTTKSEEILASARPQRIQDLQAERKSSMAGESSSSVKRESRPPPIDVDSYQTDGEVIDLTGED